MTSRECGAAPDRAGGQVPPPRHGRLDGTGREQAGQEQGGESGSGAMVEQTVSREFVVGMAKGLHLRPADMLAREARRWRSRVEVIANSQRVDGKSILDVMTLAAEAGARVAIEVTGPDARQALDAIGELFQRNFDETGGGEEPAGDESPAADTA